MNVLLPLALVVVAVAAPPELGTPLRQDGYSVRPPAGFRMSRMDAFGGSRVGAVPYPPGGARQLSVALQEGDGPEAASLLVAVVDGTFVANDRTRDAFSAAAIRHFSEELGMPLALDRAEVIRGVSPRVEVRATLKQRDQVRGILVAAMEGEGRHAVLTFSLPSSRFDAELPTLQASLDTFRADRPPASDWTRNLARAAIPFIGLLLFASWWLWRRRQARREESAQP